MQVNHSSQTPYAALFSNIPNCTKLFALFLVYLLIFLYLCAIKHVQRKIQPNATKSESIDGEDRTRDSLLSLHPAKVRLGKTEGSPLG